ncbi:signal recognition particle-docking protein FtsY [Rheinheimera texasensis]|uniref:signal recognition particle-docking protein FtsY n=1 Tax=Rheinheimera texasensis TaxID=306205 RepID=UPI0032B18487
MTKPNKLFSWLGFGKKDPAPATPEVVADTAAAQTPATPAPAIPEPATPEPAVTPPPVAPQPETTLTTPTLPEEAVTAAITAPVELVETASAHIATDAVATLTDSAVTVTAEPEPEPEPAAAPVASVITATHAEEPAKKPGFFARLKQGLAKTSQNLGSGLASLFLGKKIDDELYEELETQLLLADVGVETTQKLIKQLVADANRRELKDAEALYEKLQDEMALLLDKVEQPLQIDSSTGPYVILMVGVNGVGKTTTIGKLAQQFKQQGKSVMLAAGDTFRAAAVEQLQVWGERNEIPVIAQHSGADSASVIFDAYQAAKARKIDVLIADTAGRLQNKAHLMEELKKIVRVMKKIDGAAPHEVMLTLDAGTGQNALSQAKLFHEAVQLTGITLTKLDGTAKGGVIFAIADQFSLPIRYIGVGEGIDDLRVFHSKDFIRALFNREF